MTKNSYSSTWFELFLETIQPVQTEKEIDFLVRHLPNPPHTSILDVCCGQGRHSRLLAARGYQVTGIDLNAEAIEKVRQTSNGQVSFRQMDMRDLAQLPASFDAVVNLWQSFGYFDESTNTTVLKNMSAKLNPHGRLVLDIYHRGFFEAHQGSMTFEREGVTVTETKSISNKRMTVTLNYGTQQEPDIFEWQLYTPAEIISLAKDVGFECKVACTGFDEKQSTSDTSPRMQLVFEKEN